MGLVGWGQLGGWRVGLTAPVDYAAQHFILSESYQLFI